MSVSTIPPPPTAPMPVASALDRPGPRRAFGLTGAVALAGVLAASSGLDPMGAPSASLAQLALPEVSAAPPGEPRRHVRWPEPLTQAQRQRGFNECFQPDPAGLGPYAPYREMTYGRLAIPQKGGHTDDFGFDVVLHFHGHRATRKTLAQVAEGVVFAGVELGLGSGPYADTFAAQASFELLVAQIERGLKEHVDDDRAHIRHLALSAWSAGYGAVNSILRYARDRVDAVVLLDGLHAHWAPGHPRDGTPASVQDTGIRPVVEYAQSAARGEGIFIFTHSTVDPVRYPSTALTADLVLAELGMTPEPVESAGPHGQSRRARRGDAYVWGYRGGDELGHCAQIPHIAEALHVLEAAWSTPPMDRDVEPTPAPPLPGSVNPKRLH